MEDIRAVFETAIEQHQHGNPAAAVDLYRRVLDENPRHWDSLYLLGTALLQLGRFQECIVPLRQVVMERPDVPDAHNNLGVAYKAVEDWENAAREFEAALRANPEYDQAFFNLGTLMEERGLFVDAEKCYARACELNPSDVPSLIGLGKALQGQKKWTEAEQTYRNAITQDPQHLEAHARLAFILVKQEKLAAAADIYRQVLEVQPDYHEIRNNLSYVYERQGEIRRAIDCARETVQRAPSLAEGYNNFGIALRSDHQLDEACDAFQQALALRPNFPLAEFNWGTTRLLQGRYREGWPGYERRTETLPEPPRSWSQPRWKGQPIPGRTLLVYSDQGFGDALQFVRFLPQIRERSGARIVLECQAELVRLFAGQPGADLVVAESGELPEFDYQLPLSSAGAVLAVTLENLVAEIPYVAAAAPLRPELADVLSSAEKGSLKVGLAWQGNPEQARDVLRSCPLEILRPLADIPGVTLFSLQVGETGRGQIEAVQPRMRLHDLGSHFEDFADTAAVLDHLDLVVTVDSAVAHLAGALGKTTWALLCHTPDWRWLLERTDSPWYPTMRLFRQPRWGAWDVVVADVVREMRNLE